MLKNVEHVLCFWMVCMHTAFISKFVHVFSPSNVSAALYDLNRAVCSSTLWADGVLQRPSGLRGIEAPDLQPCGVCSVGRLPCGRGGDTRRVAWRSALQCNDHSSRGTRLVGEGRERERKRERERETDSATPSQHGPATIYDSSDCYAGFRHSHQPPNPYPRVHGVHLGL